MIDCKEWLLARRCILLVIYKKLNDAFHHLINLRFVSFPAPHVPLCSQFDTIQHTDSYNKHEVLARSELIYMNFGLLPKFKEMKCNFVYLCTLSLKQLIRVPLKSSFCKYH